MSQTGLESFGAYQKDRALFESYYLKRISVSTQAEQAGAFSRPFGTWGSHFNAFPGLKAWAIFDCPSGTGQGTGFLSPLHSTVLSMDRRANMPLLRSLLKDQRALSAIDMALLPELFKSVQGPSAGVKLKEVPA